MPVFSDCVVIKMPVSRRKKSKAGRPKTCNFLLRFHVCGHETFVQMDPPRVARLAGVNPSTVYHWIAGTKTPGAVTQQLLEIKLAGLFPWKGWEGWRLCPHTARLLAPNGYSFAPGELAYWSLQKQLIGELQRENAELRIQMAQMREQINEQAANHVIPFTRPQKKAR